MGRKSLAEELAELANPAPEADPEEDVFGAGPVLLESEDEEGDGEKGGKRRAKENGLILRGDIDLDGAVYTGKRTTRDKMFGDQEETSSRDEEGESGEDEDEEEADEEEGDREEMDSEGEDGGGGAMEGSPQGIADEGEGSEEEDGGEEERMGGSPTANQRSRSDFFGNQLETQEEEEAKLRAAMAKRAETDVTKGKAVACQQRLHKTFVEYRILLQQVLEGTNRMPQTAWLESAAEMDEIVSTAKTNLAASAVETLTSLRELQAGIAASNPTIGDVSADETRGGDGDANGAGFAESEWNKLDAAWAATSQYITTSIDRWHRKTMLGSGGAALRSKLKALNQTPSQHVASMMEEPSKWVARSRLPVGSVHRVGEDEAVEGAAESADDHVDEETFDDADFYQVLLKEFLEGEVGGGSYAATTRKKRKKTVDRRASKGRKLRYDVHEKLVNFMTPVEHAVPSFAPQVFSNLFGRKASNADDSVVA